MRSQPSDDTKAISRRPSYLYELCGVRHCGIPAGHTEGDGGSVLDHSEARMRARHDLVPMLEGLQLGKLGGTTSKLWVSAVSERLAELDE